MNFSGACHCGNIKFEIVSDKHESAFVPRECSCSLCRMHRASWISDPGGELLLKFSEPEITRYQFGHKTSDFIVCKTCGALVVALCEIDSTLRAVINIRTMPEGTFSSEPVTTNFDEEDVEGRLARRGKNWTGKVVISE